MRHSRFAIALISLVPGLVVASPLLPAEAARSDHGLWGSVVNLSRPAAATYAPDIALDRDGNALAVWVRGDGARSHLNVARRPAGHAWSAPYEIPGSGGAVEAKVAFDGDGDAVVAFTAGRAVRAVRRSAGRSWGEPVTLHRTATGEYGTFPAYLDLAVNGRGGAVVTWETMDDDRDATYATARVQAVVGSGTGGWTPVRNLSSDSGAAARADGVVTRDGRVTVIWAQSAGAHWQVMAASREAGASWGAPRALSSEQLQSGSPRIAALPSGEVAVAWDFDVAGSVGIVVRRWTPDEGWGRAVALPLKRDVRWLDLGMAGAGTLTVGWTNSLGAVWAAEQARSGEWTRDQVAPRGSVFHGLELAVNRAGDALIGWDAADGDHHPVAAAYRADGDSWGPPTTLSPRGDAGGLALAIDRDGDAATVWLYRREGSVRSRVQSRSFGASDG